MIYCISLVHLIFEKYLSIWTHLAIWLRVPVNYCFLYSQNKLTVLIQNFLGLFFIWFILWLFLSFFLVPFISTIRFIRSIIMMLRRAIIISSFVGSRITIIMLCLIVRWLMLVFVRVRVFIVVGIIVFLWWCVWRQVTLITLNEIKRFEKLVSCVREEHFRIFVEVEGAGVPAVVGSFEGFLEGGILSYAVLWNSHLKDNTFVRCSIGQIRFLQPLDDESHPIVFLNSSLA